MKMLKVKVSGSFRTKIATDDGRHPFEGVEGIIPAGDWEWHITHATRMFPIWLKEDKRFEGVNFEGLIKIRVDEVEEVESTPICLHKDIKALNWDELQSLACYKRLRKIPMYQKGDIRRARENAYEAFEEIVNGKRIFKTPKEVSDFRKRMGEKELNENEIEKMISEALNMVEDPERPDTSYSFLKLPSIYVDGILIDKKEKVTASKPEGSDK